MKKIVFILVMITTVCCFVSCNNSSNENETFSYWDINSSETKGAYYDDSKEVMSFDYFGGLVFWLELPEEVQGETLRVTFHENELGDVGPHVTEWKRTSDNKKLFIVAENHEWVVSLYEFFMKSNGYVHFEVLKEDQVIYEINIPTRKAILSI